MMKQILAITLVTFFFFQCGETDSKKNEPTLTAGVTADEEPGIVTASPATVGIDSSFLDSMTRAIVSNEYPNIHSVLIVKEGKLVYENYFPGLDEILGLSLGRINHGRDSLHDIRSVTKSFTGACIGLAISQGKIKSDEQSVWDFFPEYASLKNRDNAGLTLKHLLTMTAGFEWDESVPYTSPKNSEIAMDQSDDPLKFVLSRKVVSKPGSTFNYSGGATELQAAIIQKATGFNVEEFAKQYLFAPLHIDRYYWIKVDSTNPRKNVPAAASGLRLRSRDLVKFGLLYMNDGKVDDKQILSADWVENSHRTQILYKDSTQGYGYQFWTSINKIGTHTVRSTYALGNGDQRIFFDRTNKLLVVMTAGNYNQWDIKNGSVQLLQRFIYPSFLK